MGASRDLTQAVSGVRDGEAEAFTRGTWAVVAAEDDFDNISVCAFDGDPADGIMADVVCEVTAIDDEECARLIAAAPDLLAAAQTVLAGLCERLENAPGNAVPVFAGIADLSDAIMKALGPSAQDTTEQSDQTREEQ